MAIMLLRSAQSVFVSIPEWERRLRPYCLGRQVPFSFLPVFSTIPLANHPERVRGIRGRHLPSAEGALFGHFGTYSPGIRDILEPAVIDLLSKDSRRALLLTGLGSGAERERLIQQRPELSDRIHATGTLSAEELSLHLQACDLMIQPFPKGVSSRRTSVMAALAHGRAVVTNAGRFTEPFWRSGAVSLAEGDSPGAIVQCAEMLARDPARRRELGFQGLAFYQDRFDIRHTIDAFLGADAPTSDPPIASVAA
jgi:glycosyltransferase involved in cell wall biosynthesis